MTTASVSLRTIESADDATLAGIIRSALAEFGANRPGTVYYDPTTDHLSALFETPRSIYFVAEAGGSVLGGAGIFPTPGLPEDTAEIVKIYLDKAARGRGLGKLLVSRCLDWAQASGYRKIYLESMPELARAVAMYEKFGFKHLAGPMGNSGHFGCNVWMLLEF